MEVDRQYVDSHGQSTVGFAFCRLLGFELLPRLKAIRSKRLYRPDTGRSEDYPNLQPVLSNSIRWDLIRKQYDELVKFTTALREGTTDAESILRRFTRNNLQHPTYKALSELGKACRTIFLCRYLRLPELRREIQEGLNVVDNWNSANDFILFGKGSEMASNRLNLGRPARDDTLHPLHRAIMTELSGSRSHGHFGHINLRVAVYRTNRCQPFICFNLYFFAFFCKIVFLLIKK